MVRQCPRQVLVDRNGQRVSTRAAHVLGLAGNMREGFAVGTMLPVTANRYVTTANPAFVARDLHSGNF